MKVLDPGHEYTLDSLDGDLAQRLIFVKREGTLYPGNVGSHPGTTSQEVIRALIDRAKYVNNQMPCPESTLVTSLLTAALYLLESRAARRHDRFLSSELDDIVTGVGKCVQCNHVGCDGSCRKQHLDHTRCPFVLAGMDQHGNPIQGGRCLLQAGHKDACTDGANTWTDKSNW